MSNPHSSVPAGWYPDPGDPRALRWFDGARWTAQSRPAPGPQVSPASQASTAPPGSALLGAYQPGPERPSLYSSPFVSAPRLQASPPGPQDLAAAPSALTPASVLGAAPLDAPVLDITDFLAAPTRGPVLPAHTPSAKARRLWGALRPGRPSGSKAASWAGAVLILAAFSVLSYAIWESVGTTIYAKRAQSALAAEFSEAMAAAPSSTTVPATPADAAPAPYVAPVPPEHPPAMPPVGELAGRLTIPKIGVDSIVQVGTTTQILREGPGVWIDGVFPGAPGNATISGHRTTYGAPFRNIDQLTTGDRIVWEAPGHLPAVFEVRGKNIVSPQDVQVTEQGGGVRLTLTSCDPPGSAARRLVVQAELVEGEFAALALPADQWEFIG